jgi:hypothetical protein
MSLKRPAPHGDHDDAAAGARTPPSAHDLLPSDIHIGRSPRAHNLGIGTTMLYKLIVTGDLPTVRVRRRVMTQRDDLNAHVDRLEGLGS